jgi:hypothetical protein
VLVNSYLGVLLLLLFLLLLLRLLLGSGLLVRHVVLVDVVAELVTLLADVSRNILTTRGDATTMFLHCDAIR